MFTPYPKDPVEAGLRRILEVETFTTHWPAYDICRADLEQQEEWLRWTQCLVTNIPYHQFSDLFPKEAIAKYRDYSGNALPGLRYHDSATTEPHEWHRFMMRARQSGYFATGEPAIYWEYIDPKDASLSERENYLRLKALPKVINVLLQAFQNGHRVATKTS